MLSDSNFQCIQCSNSSNLPSNSQTLKLRTSQTFEPRVSQTFKLSKVEKFKPSTPQSLNLSTFQTSKLSNFQTFWVSNFQTPSSQTFELEPAGRSVNPYASPAVLRLAPSRNARCRGFKLPSWIPIQTFKLQTRAHFTTRNIQNCKIQALHSPNSSNI